VTLVDFNGDPPFAETETADGATLKLERVTEPVPPGASAAGRIVLTSRRPQRNGAWAKTGMTFTPYANLADKGIGVWIHGDGRGALLNIQVQSPAHLHGGICERYVRIDFEGWRYVELIEPESDAIVDWDWPYGLRRADWGKHPERLMLVASPLLYYPVNYQNIESLNLWLNNLPADGETTITLGPIKAVPLVKTTIRNPAVTIDGKTITFPVELESGSYLEFHGPGEGRIYNAKGDTLGDVPFTGEIPVVKEGVNEVTFTCEGDGQQSARANVTVITRGRPL
jgi:hypothetical protein